MRSFALTVVLPAVWLAGTADRAWCAQTAAVADPTITSPAFTWSNPLPLRYVEGQSAPRTEIRDPCIIRDGDTYFLTFTMWPFRNREERFLKEPNQGGSPGIALYSSRDLKDWKFQNWLVKSAELPEDCPYKNRFWAPEIHRINGKFYLIFTADNWIDGKYNKPGHWGSAGYCFIGVADKVTGPYEHITYVEGGTCDMTLFGDSDREIYAIKPKGDIFVQKMDLDGIGQGRIQFVGPEKKVVACKNDDIGVATSPEYLEGPWMEKNGDQYCLFYAEIYKDKACPDFLGYRTGVAYADNIAGPYKKDPRGQVFFGGHLAVFDGPDRRKWFSYRWEKDDSARGLLCIDPFEIDGHGKVQARETRGSGGWRPAQGPLMTRWAAEVGPENALPEYPRPQMAREQWLNLNGLWDYAITTKSEERAPENYQAKILVPYGIESALSGVMKPLLPKDKLWYRRNIILPQAWREQRILLHFGAVDWLATVYLNGREVGSHRGGYDAFTIELTNALKPEGPQELVVAVWDPTDSSWQLHGKQALHPGGCSYTATSGIWQTVWIEPVPMTTSIESLHAVPDLEAGTLRLAVTGRVGNEPVGLVATAFDGEKEVGAVSGQAGFGLSTNLRENKVDFYKNTGSWFSSELVLPIEDAKPWSPDRPFLYDLRVEMKRDGAVLDRVQSYFGMRSLGKQSDAKGFTRFLLNGAPTLLAGALDQGFWPDGIHTAATDEALQHDVEIARKLGFNIIRKHVKVEPDRFYYWCDRLGLMVLQDMPTGGEGDPKTDLPTSPEASAQCEMEKRALIQQRWNHPSIVAWCPFNEGWGQHDTLRYAAWIKDMDPSRLVDEASGFPWHGGGDIQDNHGGTSRPNTRQIGIVSENGGFGLATPGHDWPCEIWTYNSYDPATGKTIDAMGKGIKGKQLPGVDERSKAWFTRQVARMYAELWAQKDTNGMTGQFFCQLYDTESECDGLMSYDRAVWKVDPDTIHEAAAGKLNPALLDEKK